VEAPETRYAKSAEGAHVAYQVVGSGPFDLVFRGEWMCHLDLLWEEPTVARMLSRLASFSRLILLDPRGTGLSDPVSLGDLPTVEEWMGDIRVVMDAVGSDRAALVGTGGGGGMTMLFAATYTDRVSGLVLIDTSARLARSADYPDGIPPELFDEFLRWVEPRWGTGAVLRVVGPSRAEDPGFRRWHGRLERQSVAPGAYQAIVRMLFETDLRPVLRTISAPTRVVHRTGNRFIPIQIGRLVSAGIAGSTFVELPGEDHLFYTGDTDALIDEVEEFLTGIRSGPEADRVLATVLFTDMVGSTAEAARVGDRRWREIVEAHNAAVRLELGRFRGVEVDTAGDGFFATFDGPARAIRCARSIRQAVEELGVTVRIGLHTGECELVDGKVGGIAVNTGSRIASLAGPREILVSRTVVDLVAGSGTEFDARGTHALKGVPGSWDLFAVR
jgi:class 3 adenylate cyclase